MRGHLQCLTKTRTVKSATVSESVLFSAVICSCFSATSFLNVSSLTRNSFSLSFITAYSNIFLHYT